MAGNNNNRSALEVKDDKLTAVMERYSGPIPHPTIIGEYEKILPGSADRILSMAEKQSEHRQKLENNAVKSQTRNSTLGLIFGFVIVLLFVGLGGYALHLGQLGFAFTSFITSLGGLVGTFMYGTYSKRKEREENQKEFTKRAGLNSSPKKAEEKHREK